MLTRGLPEPDRSRARDLLEGLRSDNERFRRVIGALASHTRREARS